MYSNFSVHTVFMCRPCAKLFSSANILPAMGPPCMDSIFHIELISEIEDVFWWLNAEHISHYHSNLIHFLLKPTCVDESRLGEKPAHLTPYYSLSSISKRDISSTSHSYHLPGVAIHMICCVSRAKMYFEHAKFMFSCSFALFFSIFKFFKFSMIFKPLYYQIRLRGLISCPEQLPNRPVMKY